MVEDAQQPKKVSTKRTIAVVLLFVLVAVGATVGAQLITDGGLFDNVVGKVVSIASLSNKSADNDADGPDTSIDTSLIDFTEGVEGVMRSDIALEVLGIGVYTSEDNLLSPSEKYSKDETLGVRFAVTNNGNLGLADWKIEADIPTNPKRSLKSADQNVLDKDETRIFLLTFDKLALGDSAISISVMAGAETAYVHNDLSIPVVVN